MSSQSSPAAAQKRGGRVATDELIGHLYAAYQQGIPPMVSHLPESERAYIAVFCYQRAHLREIGLTIAATCDRWSLVNAAGRAGDALFASSRQYTGREDRLPTGRRKVSVASLVPSSRPLPLHEDFGAADEEEPLEA